MRLALIVAACGAALAAAMGPGGEMDNKHTYFLPDVLVKNSRRFRGYSAFFSWTFALSPDGRRALTGDKDKNVVLWDVERGAVSRVLHGHGDTVFDVAFSPDGKTLFSGSLDGKVGLWDAETGEMVKELDAGSGVMSIAVSPDGRKLLTGSASGAVALWTLETGKARELSPGAKLPIVAARFSPDGRRAVTAALGDTVTVWDVASGKALRTLVEPARVARGDFIAPDGRAFLRAGKALSLVDLETGKVLRSYPTTLLQGDAATTVAFAPDGRTFVSEDSDYMLNVWETATGKRLHGFALGDHALGAAFAPDGKSLIAMVGSDLNLGAIVAWPLDAPADPAKKRYVPYPKSPAQQPRSKATAALGKLLFFDGRLSRDGSVSCATCHDPRKGWADGRPVAVGIAGRVGRRNAMTILNSGAHDPLLWDGRAASLEEQALIPLKDPKEMDSSPALAVRRLSAVRGYKPLFKEAFGDDAITAERLAQALAEFERTLVSKDSPYDRYAAGDKTALDASARRGLDLFFGKGRCFECHRLDSAGGSFVNVGLDGSSDLGRFEVTKDERDRGAFNIADLHNLRDTAPYMHDGSLKTLADVVDFYDRGGGKAPGKTIDLAPLGLTAKEKTDLLSFLESLSGDPHRIDAPKLPD